MRIVICHASVLRHFFGSAQDKFWQALEFIVLRQNQTKRCFVSQYILRESRKQSCQSFCVFGKADTVMIFQLGASTNKIKVVPFYQANTFCIKA